jgi:hypothetical protein
MGLHVLLQGSFAFYVLFADDIVLVISNIDFSETNFL